MQTTTQPATAPVIRNEQAIVLPVTANQPEVPLGTPNATWFAETRVRVGFATCVERCGFTSKAAAQQWARRYNARLPR